MSSNDFLNDSDEIISLYSSKKVKETFKTQLRKIVSNSYSSNLNNEVASKENSKNEETTFKEENNENEGNTLREEIRKNNENAFTEKNSTLSSAERAIASVESNTRKTASDDSLEIIEFSPARKTRQSERLRKKRGESVSEANLSFNSPPNKNSKRTSRKGKKSRNRKRVNIDVVVLDESVESDNAVEEEDLNPEVSVKVIWKSVNVKKFQMRKFQKFSKIFEQLSQEENILEEKIMLTFNNVRVSRNDTPDSLNLQVYHFLDGGVLSELTNCHESNSSEVDASDKISLKFQDFNKKIVKVRMDRRDKMKVGMIKCSEQLEIPIEKIKFYFDGEPLEPLETPESLGLDSDEIIDMKICG